MGLVMADGETAKEMPKSCTTITQWASRDQVRGIGGQRAASEWPASSDEEMEGFTIHS